MLPWDLLQLLRTLENLGLRIESVDVSRGRIVVEVPRVEEQ